MKEKVQPINKSSMYSAMIGLCFITIAICWIIRMFGYRGFDLDMTNVELPTFMYYLINGILYLVNSFAYLLLLYKRKLKLREILIAVVVYTGLFIMSLFKELLYIQFTLEFISYIVFALIGIKDKWYKRIIESLTICIIFILYEIIISLIHSINVFGYHYNFIESTILMIDYYILKFLFILKYYKGGYVYVSCIIRGRLVWQTIMVLFSKRKRNQTRVQQSKENVQEVGYKFFVVALAIAQFAIVGAMCYFINHVILQYIIAAFSFFIMKKVFGNSYHANRIITCTTLACIVFITITRLSLPLSISILCNIILGTILAYIMYVFYYFFKFTTKKEITIYRGMSKEDLDTACEDAGLEDIEYQVLYLYYCKKQKRYLIGNSLNYSEDTISKIKKKALDKLV